MQFFGSSTPLLVPSAPADAAQKPTRVTPRSDLRVGPLPRNAEWIPPTAATGSLPARRRSAISAPFSASSTPLLAPTAQAEVQVV